MKYAEVLVALQEPRENKYLKPVAFRSGWNGSHQFIGLCDSWNGNFIVNCEEFTILPFTYIKNTQNNIVPWVPSQSDQLAADWNVLIVDETPSIPETEIGEEAVSLSVSIKDAWDVLKRAAKEDPDWAYAVHCNLAMPCVDEGASHEVGNKAAARIMSVLFDHDITTHPHYQYRDISEEEEAKLLESYKELHPESNVFSGEDIDIPTDDLGDVEQHSV